MLQPFIEEKRAEIIELCRTHHVERLAIFGSAVRDDFDPERSDVDVRVVFKTDLSAYAENAAALRAGLRSLFGKQVDVVSARQLRNRFLESEIEATQVEMYAAA